MAIGSISVPGNEDVSLSLLPLWLFKNKDTKQTHKDHQLKLITRLNIKMTVTKKCSSDMRQVQVSL